MTAYFLAGAFFLCLALAGTYSILLSEMKSKEAVVFFFVLLACVTGAIML